MILAFSQKVVKVIFSIHLCFFFKNVSSLKSYLLWKIPRALPSITSFGRYKQTWSRSWQLTQVWCHWAIIFIKSCSGFHQPWTTYFAYLGQTYFKRQIEGMNYLLSLRSRLLQGVCASQSEIIFCISSLVFGSHYLLFGGYECRDFSYWKLILIEPKIWSPLWILFFNHVAILVSTCLELWIVLCYHSLCVCVCNI